MTLSAGTKIGPYEILAPIGAGGMGEVYRARDTRLGRDVALKVLPEIFSKDAERMARFEREAQLLASLNHPNIAALYGLEESAAMRALVMELVEGPTLAERIAPGPIALDDALPIGRQIAEALEYAHERGIVHRDLKPANIKLTSDGAVKVLDFGLAKALDDDPASGGGRNSPTMSLAATRMGVILGTAGYMSPEQAKGKPVDRRADIWAFGVVLYEMLSGKQMYSGETAAETLAAVMRDEPRWDALPLDTPVLIRRLLHRCLDKDPKRRLQAIGEARIAIEEVLSGAAEETIPAPVAGSPGRPTHAWPAWAFAAVTLLALAAGAVSFVHFREKPPAVEPVRFQISPPEKTSLMPLFALSPDGRKVAFVTRGENGVRLWVRSLEALDARALADLGNAPFWQFFSPDSHYVAFSDDRKLKKVDASGGPPQTVCDVSGSFGGGAWSQDGVIIFGNWTGGLSQISAAGVVPSPLTVLDVSRQETGHLAPSFLPDGRHFLYLRVSTTAENTGLYIGSLDDAPGKQALKRVSGVRSNAVYSPFVEASSGSGAESKNGYLLFLRESTLTAQPFDIGKLDVTGEAVPVADPVVNFDGFLGYFAASRNGALIYRSGGSRNRSQLTWFDRVGRVLGTAADTANYAETVLSPDGTRVATVLRDRSSADLWLVELARGLSTRFTFDPAVDRSPVWSPDGKQIVFASDREGAGNLYIKASSGATTEEVLLKSGEAKTPNSWSPDGRFLSYTAADPKREFALWVLPLTGDRKPTPFMPTQLNASQGQFSPDGRWIAYTSNESGRNEIYVRSFPDGSGKWQVSKGGGVDPRWRRDGKELFYLRFPAITLMSVDVTANPVFQPGAPKALFDAPFVAAGNWDRNPAYDVSPDGKRFLATVRAGEIAAAPITVVLNWQAGLRK